MPKARKLPVRLPYELRFQRPDWFPDWTGQTVVIVGGGPSAKEQDYELARGKAKVIAINLGWKLVPWADILIGADGGFWTTYKGVPAFKGLKLTADFHASRNYGLRQFYLDKMTYGISLSMPGYVGMGMNTGFYALNFAVQFGAKKIILCGFEMNVTNGVHWHGRHKPGLNNPGRDQFHKWAKIMDGEQPKLQALGVTVLNTAPLSSLKTFPKMSMSEALAL